MVDSEYVEGAYEDDWLEAMAADVCLRELNLLT